MPWNTLRNAFRSPRRRRSAACAALGDLPVTRIALIDERLQWVSLDGLLLDLANPEHAAPRPTRLADSDAELASEIVARARTTPVREMLTTVDGRRIQIDAVPIATHTERPLVLGIARDRTSVGQRSEATVADLVLSDESFRAAFDDAPGPAAMVVGPGEAGGRFLRVNDAFAQMLGTTMADLHLRETASVTHPEDRDLEPPVRGDNGTRTVRKRYLHSSGRPVQVEVRVSEVRDGDGAVSYFLNHVVNIDAQVASDRALDHASRIRRDMVSTISHELRTPLTSVQGYLEMIAGEDFGELSGEQKRMIDIAIRNAYRLEEFVTDLLMLARLDAAELDPIRHLPVDIGAVVDAAVAEVTQAAAARGHQLVVELPAAPVTVSGDAAHLKRAVQNLVANAIKYTADGGRVAITVGVLDGAVQIVVADTGIGVDPDEVALLGNRFYRGVEVQRRALGGTGLGLAITRTIVDRHSGALHICSTPGEGSRFMIELPLR